MSNSRIRLLTQVFAGSTLLFRSLKTCHLVVELGTKLEIVTLVVFKFRVVIGLKLNSEILLT